MVHTKLVFFGNRTDSWYGTLRGSISFVPLLLLCTVLNSKTDQISRNILLSLILCSAIAVQLPDSDGSALLYGSLVGLCISMSNYCSGTCNISLLVVPLATVWIAILSLVTWRVSNAYALYGVC